MRITDCAVNLSFQANYAVEVIDLTQPSNSSLEHYYYPGATKVGGKDGVLLKITLPNNQSWLATFAFGYDSRQALTGIFSCPNPSFVCVASSGQGYFVKVDSPPNWSVVDSYPLLNVYPIIERNMIIFVDYTTISAYRDDKQLWRTERLSWDGIKVDKITASLIKGRGWDASSGREVEFEVNLTTGEHTGRATTLFL